MLHLKQAQTVIKYLCLQSLHVKTTLPHILILKLKYQDAHSREHSGYRDWLGRGKVSVEEGQSAKCT